MLLGKIIGTVWATQKERSLEGMQLEIVRAIDWQGKPLSSIVVAVNAIGAGIGETVLVTQGSSARQTEMTRDKPVDAVIMAIVDNYDIYSPQDLEKNYKKREEPVLQQLQHFKEV
jgi:microcompartment protein CcmK/EutM